MSSDKYSGEERTKNWTKFPNCILDNLDKFTPTEFMVLALMVRKNIGYNDPNQMFSVRYISEKLGIDTKTVTKAITALLKKESIRITKIGTRGIRYFDINWIGPKSENTEQPEERANSDSEKNDCGKNSHSDCGKNSHEYKTNNNNKNHDCNNAESQSQSLSSDSDTEYDTLVSLVPEPMRKSVIINLIGKYHRSHGFRHVADCIVHTNQRPKREGNETWQAYRGYLAKGLAGHYEGIDGMYDSFSDKKEEREKEPTEAELLAISIRNGEKRFFVCKEKEYEITDEGYVYDFEIPDESGMIYKYMLTAEQITKIVMAGKGTLR